MTGIQGMAPVGVHSGRNSAGQGSVAKSKWQLLSVIEDIREPLGLKGTSIALLRAMLSFIRSDMVTSKRVEDHMCFASNAALARRAHVSVQTVERHVAKLVKLGLLARRSSGNGKRWARRDRQGQIVYATGLSLMPLVERHAEFLGIASALDARAQELALLRDKCAVALSEFKARILQSKNVDDLVSRARTLFRRKPDEAALRALLVDINSEIGLLAAPETKELRDIDHSIEGHKETDLDPSVKEEPSISVEVSPDQMEWAYPRLCSELRFSRTQEHCERTMADLANHLQLKEVWREIQSLGPALSFMMLGYILERIETIKTPKAYARSLFVGLNEGRLEWKSLLVKAKRPMNSKHAV
jgi:replication initiation protein RepC